MGKNRVSNKNLIEEVRRWFANSVTYNGEAYVMDAEQVAAVVDDSKNAIVVARAGSGKTRTIVAKIVYLVARCDVKPEEIMTFVFNANAAREINERLGKMMVDGVPVMEGAVRIASTFHAFARRVVYDMCDGRVRCGKILVGDKERFVLKIIQAMMKESKWGDKIRKFIGDEEVMDEVVDEYTEDINGMAVKAQSKARSCLEEQDLYKFARMMTLFINRAQQKFLAGEKTLWNSIRQRYKEGDMSMREKMFIQLGTECYRRYHWYLLDEGAKLRLDEFKEYGTDFNLIVSWASKLIASGRKEIKEILVGTRYILIDEYQDFSQLFLSVVLAIRKVIPEVRVFVVGDDWQAINRFAGSDVEYFKEFAKYFMPAKKYEITTNYRCNYMIVDTARKFMKNAMNEKGGFRAFSRRAGKVVLVNPIFTRCEYALVEYDRRVSGRDRIYMEMTQRMLNRTPKKKTVRYVKTLIQIIRKNKRANDILLLHRNNETNLEGMSLRDLTGGLRWGLIKLGVMDEEVFDAKMRVMTMHKSKGLEAEVVILLEADEGVIPKAHPDTRLYAVFGETEEVALDDQKRLFYVAMTRAKKRLYIIHNGSLKEGFVKYLGGRVDQWGE